MLAGFARVANWLLDWAVGIVAIACILGALQILRLSGEPWMAVALAAFACMLLTGLGIRKWTKK